MAPPAGERRHAVAQRVLDLRAPFPGRTEFAIRLALICALTLLVVEIYQTPEPALTVYVAFFLIKPDRATSLLVSLVFVVLITIIIGAVLPLTEAVIDQPLWRVTAIALLSFVLLFAASASKLKPVGSIIALIAGYALDVLGTVHIAEVATRALLYAWLFVIIPAAVSIVVNLLIGPAPRRLAERTLAHRLRLAATVLRDPSDRARGAFAECLQEGLGELPAWLKLAGAERTADAADLAALGQAARSTCALFSLVNVIIGAAETGTTEGRAELTACLEEMAAILERGGYPLDIAFEPNLAPDASTIAATMFAAVRDLLSNFAVAPPPELAPAVKAKTGFFVPDAFTNPVHVRYALKTTAAAMFCYIVYSLLDWPGIHTCFITCYIVSLGTTAETIEKLTLRILGCLIGAALGIGAIVFVMPGVTSIGELMAIVGLAAFAAGWVAGGSARISYVGFQLGFAFFLCVVQGSGPEFDLTIARDRVIGILFGNLVVALIFTQIWPITVATRIDPAIAALLRKLASLTREAVPWRRWALAAEAQAALGTADQDMALVGYEPPSLRPASRWTECREGILSAIAGCQGPLLLQARPDHPMNGDVADRLDQLADALDRHVSLRHTRQGTREPGPGDILGLSLVRLEQAVACTNEDASDGGADHVAT
jgi:multidrug resistance protein MdtO